MNASAKGLAGEVKNALLIGQTSIGEARIGHILS